MHTRSIACSHALLDGMIVRNVLLSFEGDVLKTVEAEVCGLDSKPSTQYFNGILVPSFTNAHSHLELSYFKGRINQGIGLVEFVKNVIKHREDVSVSERIEAARVMDRVMFENGIGAVGDISNNGFTAQLKSESGIFYHTFAEYFGFDSNPSDMTKEVLDAAREYNAVASPSPHSTYLVGDKQFLEVNEQKIASIHFMETALELEFFKKRGDMYDFVERGMGEPDFLNYGSHVDRIIESINPTVKLLLVHCTQMKQRDFERILGHFKDVTFVLCPQSNYYIGRDIPPAQLLSEMGAPVALGTDSLASNTQLSIAYEIEKLLIDNRKISLEKVLNWSTSSGAKGLGLGDFLGEFKVGTKCGAVLLEGFDLKKLEPLKSIVSRRLI